MFWVYEVLLYLVFIFALPVLLPRKKYRSNAMRRAGFYDSPAGSHDLWLHAVSVGEAIAARPIVEAIERMRPETSMVITTTTVTGQTQAKRLFPKATVTYFPLDFRFAVRRFLDHHRPRVFATMETEIWPNVTRLSRARGLRLALANGRISDRSFPRYRAFRPVIAGILAAYDRILVREEVDRERFLAIGAPPAAVETVGNVKFDTIADDAPLAIAGLLQQMIGGRRVVVLGSTLEGEDEMLCGAVESLVARGVFVVVAPRKPERFEAVARLFAGAQLRVARRSALPVSSAVDVLVLDTLGELSRIYRFADVAFVGGSLVPHGGHNPIEPAAAGVPVCFGPSMSNFREIAAVFLRAGAAEEVGDAAALEAFVVRMAEDEPLRRATGDRARATVDANRGASQRTAQRIVELLS